MEISNINVESQAGESLLLQKSKLEKISFIILLITIILTPLVFIPSAYSSLDMVKTIVITFGILISSIIYFISAFKNKTLSIPSGSLFKVSIGIIISLIISTLLSSDISKSFFGQGFELGTASFILTLFLGSLIVVYITNKERDRVLYVYGSVLVSFIIIAIFHIIRLFAGPDVLSFGIFQSLTSTMLGKWNDLAIFSGIVALLSYIGIRFITLSKLYKSLLTALLVISGLFLLIINSTIVWSVLAIVFIGLFVYQYSYTTTEKKGISGIIKRASIFTAILILISLLCAWRGDSIAKPIISKLNIQQAEIILPWQLTLDIASGSIKESPLFGAGPNRFGIQYLKYKPQIINISQFWNLEFTNGFGLIPTFVVTQGLIGTLLWIIFIILFVYTGYKALKKTQDNFSRFFIGSTFFTSAFLWLISIVYTPSHSILFLTFIFTGLFIASIISEGYASLLTVGDKVCLKLKRFVPAILIIILVALVLWISVYTKKIIALGYFQSGISSLNLPNNQGIDKAEMNFKKALSLDKSDIYYQALSEVDILKITALAQKLQADSQKDSKAVDAEAVKKISALVEEAVGYTRSASAIDPTNYYNYVAEARISEVALSLQVQNAYENTVTAYNNAIQFNPYNPALYLNLARIEASQNKFADAEKFIGISLQLKQNYIEAIFLLSQIQVNQGKIKEAITSVQVASQINPTNPLIYFQLGILQYNDKNYQEAVNALNKAVELDNQYANARYFLGLSYARLNKIPDAIVQFENLSKSNPDSQEVSLILSNLRAGRSPFADAQPPIDSKPEKRANLPIKEKTSATNKK